MTPVTNSNRNSELISENKSKQINGVRYHFKNGQTFKINYYEK
jgi:heme-binding NEAT domain protein